MLDFIMHRFPRRHAYKPRGWNTGRYVCMYEPSALDISPLGGGGGGGVGGGVQPNHVYKHMENDPGSGIFP
jgi:hypothetical protein